ncbi:DNA polymerase III subunit beta [Saccharibacillus sp. CPCC 101409]|uniref:DNA polymerase III subunit beta n=1 Tax=Saccharibacillus sp. CPCC 101409 TaxID=3058041 RepID=UPI002670ED6C|nr:DNA polymerase III subunit beta [Saccharibacillus sp. CPCC 101409]MDO3409745.1 DNA polymerase III subunit beta [Saccharibacillus sp. CPCC 101409]
MRVELARDSLIHALQHVVKAVAGNSPMPILQGIKIQAGAEGVTFTASSGSLTIRFTLPQDGASVTVARAGAIVIPSTYFYAVIRKLDDEKVTLELKEPLILTISSGPFHMRLCGMDPAEFPDLGHAAERSSRTFRMDNALLRSAVKQVAAAASASENRPVLTGVLWEYDRDSLSLIATDGIRLASRAVQMENGPGSGFNVIIPAKNLQEISRMLGDEDAAAEIEVGDSRVKFTAGRLEVESTLIRGTFPAVRSVIPENVLSEIFVDTVALFKAVERVTILAGGNTIRLAAAAERLRLSSRTAEVGDIEHEVPLLEMSGEAFALSLNGRLLLELLRGSDCGRTRIRYAGKNTPLVILPDDPLKSSLYLITSVRTPE